MIATRSTRSSAHAAATAALLKRQYPIARPGSAWWPGGRTRAKQDSPEREHLTAAIDAPAASDATRNDSPVTYVSMSRYLLPPYELSSSIMRMCLGSWTRARSSNVAGSAGRLLTDGGIWAIASVRRRLFSTCHSRSCCVNVSSVMTEHLAAIHPTESPCMTASSGTSISLPVPAIRYFPFVFTS